MGKHDVAHGVVVGALVASLRTVEIQLHWALPHHLEAHRLRSPSLSQTLV